MISLGDLDITDFICNEVSSFALSIIDIETSEVIYTNSKMNDFMIDAKEKKCYQAIYGQSSQCSWCGLKNSLSEAFDFEYFNEKTNKWYTVQNKITKLKNEKDILVSIAIDITTQKESQGQFINTHVKLVQQTQKLEKAQKELKLLASTDPMTKLFNRRYFLDMSKSILDLAKRTKSDTAVLMIDIDKFKNVNDTYGHKVGDDVLVSFSLKLKEISRKSDIVTRWGGEEFVILLANTNLNGASIIAEKIRKTTEDLIINLENNQELKFTVSIGVSNVKNDMNIEASINRADEALYEAKENGRNKVCVKR